MQGTLKCDEVCSPNWDGVTLFGVNSKMEVIADDLEHVVLDLMGHASTDVRILLLWHVLTSGGFVTRHGENVLPPSPLDTHKVWTHGLILSHTHKYLHPVSWRPLRSHPVAQHRGLSSYSPGLLSITAPPFGQMTDELMNSVCMAFDRWQCAMVCHSVRQLCNTNMKRCGTRQPCWVVI